MLSGGGIVPFSAAPFLAGKPQGIAGGPPDPDVLVLGGGGPQRLAAGPEFIGGLRRLFLGVGRSGRRRAGGRRR